MSTDGYVSEINYTYGYYAETSPARLKLALLSRGVGHAIRDDFNYLELGFGQGLSLAINAATSDGNFYGTDFNPAQVANAMELAEATGRSVKIYQDSFEQLAERADLPQFDIIVAHGIWSWVSEESRRAIIRIARDHLKPGGAFYISYNVTPGWSPAIPLRHLMAEYSRRATVGALVDRIGKAIDFVDRVIKSNAAYFAMHPQLGARLDTIRKQDPHYIAHEYFNAEWEPMPFSRVADMLGEAQLSFAGSAHILDNISALSVPSSALAVLGEISDPILRETVLDYFVNRQFRRDIFVKGPRPLDQYQLRAQISKQHFALTTAMPQCPATIAVSAGEAELKQDIYLPLLACLDGADDKSCSVEDIIQNAACQHLEFGQIWEALLVLTGIGVAAPVDDIDDRSSRTASSKALNHFICNQAESSTAIQFLASPVLGAGISVPWIDQLFHKANANGIEDVPRWAWSILSAQGKRLIVEGKDIVDEDLNIAELRRLFAQFEDNQAALIGRLTPLV